MCTTEVCISVFNYAPPMSAVITLRLSLAAKTETIMTKEVVIV